MVVYVPVIYDNSWLAMEQGYSIEVGSSVFVLLFVVII